MLIVVKYRNIANFFEPSLDLKATGCAYILKIYSAKRAREQIYRPDDLINVLTLDAKRKCVNVGKRLEERAFSLHDRHSRLRTDVTETENRTSVGNDRNDVGSSRQLV